MDFFGCFFSLYSGQVLNTVVVAASMLSSWGGSGGLQQVVLLSPPQLQAVPGSSISLSRWGGQSFVWSGMGTQGTCCEGRAAAHWVCSKKPFLIIALASCFPALARQGSKGHCSFPRCGAAAGRAVVAKLGPWWWNLGCDGGAWPWWWDLGTIVVGFRLWWWKDSGCDGGGVQVVMVRGF